MSVQPVQDPSTDETTEYNRRCQKCRHAYFNTDAAGRRMFKIGKCNAKSKYIVSRHQVDVYDCEKFKRLS